MRYAALYLATVALIALATGIVALVRVAVSADNTAMIYLLAVLASGVLFGSRTAIVAAVGSFFAFNFFFVSPRYTFTVGHEDEWIALFLLLLTGVITGQLAAALRDRARRAEEREREAVALYDAVRLVSDPALPGALERLAERLRQELCLSGVLITLGEPINVTVTAGEARAAESAAHPPMILAGGTPPSPTAAARPGRWIKLVSPLRGTREVTDVVRSVPLSGSGGQPAGVITLFSARDANVSVDERLLSAIAHQLGQALERLRLQREATDAEVLRRTDEARAALLNAVSHDLRTPLASIIATGDNLLSRDLEWTEDERRTFVSAIVGEAARLDRLVGNLLDVSRIEAGALRLSLALHDLLALINEVAGRAEAAHSATHFEIDDLPDLPPVPMDYVQIEQVLANLLENAVLHGASPVRISVIRDRDEVRVAVEDSGTGIPAADIPRLFEAFSRSSDSRPGTGLGLAIARGFVTAHAGRIWAENTRGGARIVFTLPLVAVEAPVR